MTDAKRASTQRSSPRARDVWRDVRARPQEPRELSAHIGLRVYQRRMALGMNQRTLAMALGVGIDNIRLYERGRTLISLGLLSKISVALDAPFSYFFENAPRAGNVARPATLPDDETERVNEFLFSKNGDAIVRACARLDERMRLVVRRHVERLARAFAG
jgi:transcriptional regulator with XRE-family HTH domain